MHGSLEGLVPILMVHYNLVGWQLGLNYMRTPPIHYYGLVFM